MTNENLEMAARRVFSQGDTCVPRGCHRVFDFDAGYDLYQIDSAMSLEIEING